MVKKKVEIEVSATGIEAVNTKFKTIGTNISGLVSKYAAFSVMGYSVIEMAKQSIKAYMESERVLLKLKQQIGGTAYAMQDYANKLSMITAEDDESIMGMMAMLAVTVKNEEQLKKLSAATIDFAKFMGIDLTAAGEMVMRTLQGTRNAFMMYGVDLKGAKTEQEKLNILIQRFGEIAGGYAADAANTLEGRITRLGIVWENLQESVGGALGNIMDFLLMGGGSAHDFAVYQAELAVKMAEATAEMPKEASLLELLKIKTDALNAAKEAAMTPYDKWLRKHEKEVALLEQEVKFQERLWAATTKLEIAEPDLSKIVPILPKHELKEIEKITVGVYDNMGDAADEYKNTVQNIAMQMSDVWAQALMNQWNSGQSFFTNMARGFEQMLASMIAQLASRAAIFGIFSLFSGGSALLGGDFTKFLFKGFQHGGQFTVGGSGAPDSKLVAFRASPGERVTVTPPGVTNSSQSMTINFNSPITDKRFIQQEIIPEIKRAVRLGLA